MNELLNLNLLAGWIGMLLGALSGAILGMFFHRSDWMGGYASYPRRMMRLGHIAFFGLALLNIAFVFTMNVHPMPEGSLVPAAYAMIVAAVTMPACCFLAAWRRPLRHLFPIPVAALGFAIVLVLITWFEVSS